MGTRGCDEVRRVLPDFVEDALAASTRTRIERHLARCLECAREERTLRRARALLSALPRLRMGGARRGRVLEEFRRQRSPEHRPTPPTPPRHTDPHSSRTPPRSDRGA